MPTPTRLTVSRSSLRSVVLVAVPTAATVVLAVVLLVVAVETVLVARAVEVSSVRVVEALLPVAVVVTSLPTRAGARPRLLKP